MLTLSFFVGVTSVITYYDKKTLKYFLQQILCSSRGRRRTTGENRAVSNTLNTTPVVHSSPAEGIVKQTTPGKSIRRRRKVTNGKIHSFARLWYFVMIVVVMIWYLWLWFDIYGYDDIYSYDVWLMVMIWYLWLWCDVCVRLFLFRANLN